MKLVLVKWFDTYSNDRWEDIDRAKKWGSHIFEVRTVGWLIDETDKYVLLSSGISNCETANMLIHIPKTNIIEKIDIDL